MKDKPQISADPEIVHCDVSMVRNQKVLTVGEIFDVQLGKMLSKKAKKGTLYPYLANFNVRWGHFDLSKMNEMHFTDEEKEKYRLEENDILVCEGGEIGRCAIWQGNSKEYFYQKALHRLRAYNKGDINPYFFYFCMQYSCSNKLLTRIVGETSIAHLTREKLINIKFPYPERVQQDQIVQILRTWEDTIEKTEALIDARERQFNWLHSNIIKNTRNTVIYQFGDFLKESRIIDTENDPRKRITVRLHLKGVGIREYRRTESEGSTQYFIRKAGQLIYGKQNIFRGSIGIIPNELDGYSSSQDIPAFDIADNIFSDWLFWYISRPAFYRKLEHFATGSGSKRLHQKELFRLKIPVPDLEDQVGIAEVLNTSHHEISLLKKLTDLYRMQKYGLMQKLLVSE